MTQVLDISLPQNQLREITDIGLGRLRRTVHRLESGTQYLRAIAAEGGIPVKLLSDQKGGYRAALVGLVADLSRIGLSCPWEVALGFAAQRTRRLPVGYRTREYHALFVNFAFEILELRELSPEGKSVQNVEAFLDLVKPDWRDSLSLRLDGDAARSLLSDAVLVSARHGLVTDPLKRVLRRGEGDIWTSWIEVEETAEIAPQLVRDVEPERRRLRLAPVGSLASAVPDLLFALDREGPDRPWESRRISGGRTARFRFPLDSGADMMAMADGAFLGRVRLAGGEVVEIGAGPTFWRLAEMGEARAEALAYAGNATLRTRDPHVWMLAEAGKTPNCAGTLVAERDGSVPGGAIWRLSGKGRVLVAGGNARIETGADEEAREEIHANGPLEYRVLDRQGTPVHRGQRLHAVCGAHVFADARAALEGQGKRTRAQMLHALAVHYRAGALRPFTHAVVDEAQDITVPELQFLAAIAGDRPNGLFFAGDIGQRIFRAPFPWKAAGVDVRGRSRSLKVNYRTSQQIRSQSDRLLPPSLTEADGNEDRRTGVVSLFDGPAPKITEFPNADAEIEAVAAWLAELAAIGVTGSEVVLLVRSEDEIPRARAVQSALLSLRGCDAEPEIRVMHEAKGAEYRAVAVMACDEDVIPKEDRLLQARDEAMIEEIMATERHLLYVATTRAREHLWVSGAGRVSEFLEDLV